MKVFLTMGRDGRILIQARIEQQGLLGHVLHYVGQGENFNGVSYDDFAKSTPGSMDLPDQGPGMVQPDMSQMGDQGQQAEQPQPAQQPPVEGQPVQ